MIERLLNFLTAMETPAAAPKPDELELAVAALLIEAARMDEHFDAVERSAIERLLAERFDLTPEAVSKLVEAAEQRVRDTAQYFPFTREISKRLSMEQRVGIIRDALGGRLCGRRPRSPRGHALASDCRAHPCARS
jgi:uncharacterized tellurite resistance protein B-like protein